LALPKKSKVEEEARDEDGLAERAGERDEERGREFPEREWNQYVEASVCPYMRVSMPRETKHVSFHAG